jgi:hypothetical protein
LGEDIREVVAKKGGDIGLPAVQAHVNALSAVGHIDFIDDCGSGPLRPVRVQQIYGHGLDEVGGIKEDRLKRYVMGDDLGREIGGGGIIGDVLAKDGKAHDLFGRLSLDTLGAPPETESQNQKKTSHNLHIKDEKDPVRCESGMSSR